MVLFRLIMHLFHTIIDLLPYSFLQPKGNQLALYLLGSLELNLQQQALKLLLLRELLTTL